MEPASLLDLPPDTLVILVSGYLAYRVAYDGRTEGLRAMDVVFITLTFGLLAKAVVELCRIEAIPAQAAVGAGAALMAAGLWRKWGREWWFRLLRRAGVSMSDGQPTALQSVVRRESIAVTQVLVQRKNGSDLLCKDTSAFEDAPTGPHWFGEDGSVALHVTHVRPSERDEWVECEDVRHEDGDLITVVPADEIAVVEIRTTKAQRAAGCGLFHKFHGTLLAPGSCKDDKSDG